MISHQGFDLGTRQIFKISPIPARLLSKVEIAAIFAEETSKCPIVRFAPIEALGMSDNERL